MILRAPFTNSILFAVVAPARKREVLYVPKDQTSIGGEGFTLRGVPRRDEAGSITSSAYAQGLNGVLGVYSAFPQACRSLSALNYSHLEC